MPEGIPLVDGVRAGFLVQIFNWNTKDIGDNL